MEVQAACEDIGTRQAFKAQLRTVCASTDGLDHTLHPGFLDGTPGDVDDVLLTFQLLLHIIILVSDVGLDNALSIALFKDSCQVSYEVFPFLKALPLIALGALRHLGSRHLTRKLRSDEAGVTHLILGITRVNIKALDMNGRTGSVEVLILQFAHL